MDITINFPQKLVGKERIVINLLETEDGNKTFFDKCIVTRVYFEWVTTDFETIGKAYRDFIVVDSIIGFDELKVGEYYVFEYFDSGMGYNYISLIDKTDIIYDKDV